MLFKGLIILLLLNSFLFFTGKILVKNIQKKSRRIGNILRKAYVAMSYIAMVYAIIFLIYTLCQKNGVYNIIDIKIAICLLSFLLVIVNIVKLLLLKEESDVLYDCYWMGISLIGIITLCLSLVGQNYETVSVIREFVEEVAYQSIDIVKSTQSNEEKNTKNLDYDLAVIDCENSMLELGLNNNIVNVTDSDKKYIQKYKIEEKLNNIFESYKTEEYYEYIIYTPLESEKTLVNFYNSK